MGGTPQPSPAPPAGSQLSSGDAVASTELPSGVLWETELGSHRGKFLCPPQCLATQGSLMRKRHTRSSKDRAGGASRWAGKAAAGRWEPAGRWELGQGAGAPRCSEGTPGWRGFPPTPAQQDHNSASPALTAAQRARLSRERNRALAFDSYCLSSYNLGELSWISEPCLLRQSLICFLTTPRCSPPQTHPQTHRKLTRLPSSAAAWFSPQSWLSDHKAQLPDYA